MFIKFLIRLFLLTLILLNKELKGETIPFISCSLRGQLGDDLSCIATVLANGWDKGLEPLFPDLNQQNARVNYNRKQFFFRLNFSHLPHPPMHYFDEKVEWGNYEAIPNLKDLYLKGNFFSWYHFHYYRDRLINLFAPSEQSLNYLIYKYADLLSHPQTVSIYIKATGDKEVNEYKFSFLGFEYYWKAMQIFPENTLFVVFSDNINLCKLNFAQCGRSVFFVEENDPVYEFYLMSMMKNHIIGNSEYSWWAAYLNQQAHKIIAPRYWFTQNQCHLPINPAMIFLPDWIILD